MAIAIFAVGVSTLSGRWEAAEFLLELLDGCFDLVDLLIGLFELLL